MNQISTDRGLAYTVLNFDDSNLAAGAERRITDGYGGFRWIEAGVYRPDGSLPGYVPASGTTLAFIAEANSNELAEYGDAESGAPLTIIRDTPFALESASFVAAFRDGLTITVRAFADAAGTQLIGEKTFSADRGALTAQSFTDDQISGTFFGATRVEFSANDGNGATADYFGIDDLAFTSLVPVTLGFENNDLAPGAEAPLLDDSGFNFEQIGIYRPDGALPGYAVASGDSIAFIAEANGNEIAGYESGVAGAPATITNTVAFALLSGSFSALQRDGLTVTVRGYADVEGTELVVTQQIVFDRGSAQEFDFSGFVGLHRVEFDSNDGNAATGDYFGFDDLQLLVAGTPPVIELVAQQLIA